MDREAAIAAGAMALFGEKYGDEVRVVSMGREPDGRTTSIELCGGTHCARTGDIALFKITSESAVAAGIRRIEALTGEAAYRHVRDEERLLGETAEALKVTPQDLPERVVSLMTERRRLEQEISKLRQQLATGGAAEQAEAKEIAGIRFAGAPGRGHSGARSARYGRRDAARRSAPASPRWSASPTARRRWWSRCPMTSRAA